MKKKKAPESRETLTWQLVKDLYALTDAPHSSVIENEVQRIDATTVVVRANKSHQSAQSTTKLHPVYRNGSNGPLGVPTGSIYVRLKNQKELIDYTDEFAGLGFEIEKQSIAGTGWLKHKSASLEATLQSAEHLSTLEGVALVEPQFITASSSRRSYD
ncbi:MAG: hypothetical protein ACRBHB_17235 [Arenicella sp.]